MMVRRQVKGTVMLMIRVDLMRKGREGDVLFITTPATDAKKAHRPAESSAWQRTNKSGGEERRHSTQLLPSLSPPPPPPSRRPTWVDSAVLEVILVPACLALEQTFHVHRGPSLMQAPSSQPASVPGVWCGRLLGALEPEPEAVEHPCPAPRRTCGGLVKTELRDPIRVAHLRAGWAFSEKDRNTGVNEKDVELRLARQVAEAGRVLAPFCNESRLLAATLESSSLVKTAQEWTHFGSCGKSRCL
ncbi:hypothetical protein J3F83DRAFT_261650 [Trichoderma novae-zelandiae]